MQVFVSFPDAGYPDVVFEAAGKSLVTDATQTAADEWGVDADFLELAFSGSVIPQNSLLVSHGVEGGSQLTASLLQVFGCKWFTDDSKREKLMQHLSKVGEHHLFLDTPSFTTDGCFHFHLAWVPRKIEISFINPHPSITSVEFSEPDYMMDQVSPVTKVDLSGLRDITSIGDHFLSMCSSITTLDVSCLDKVRTIGLYCLAGLASLTTLRMGSFNNVTEIGAGFLAECKSLSALDLESFNNVTKAGDDFLGGCPSLTSLDLGSFNKITMIEGYFLASCSSLTKLNLRSLSNVTEIGCCFLSDCSSFTELDLGAFNNVTKIGDYFLARCTSLTTLDLRSFNNVTEIDDAKEYFGLTFLKGCSSLTEVNVTGIKPGSVVRERIEELGFPAPQAGTRH